MKKLLHLLFILLILTIVLISHYRYSGNTINLLIFHISFFLLLLSIKVRPFLYITFFFSIFLFLGFYVKFIIHLIYPYDFIEPVGYFDNAAKSWDHALIIISCGVLGFAFPLFLRSTFKNYFVIKKKIKLVSQWYRYHYKLVRNLFIIAAFLLYVWNYHAAIYQIGIKPLVILPFHFNILIAWLLNVGIVYIIALIFNLERSRNPQQLEILHYAVMIMALLGSISVLSRAIFLYYVFPFIFVTYRNARLKMTKLAWTRVSISFFIILFVSLATIQILRDFKYIPAIQITQTPKTQTWKDQASTTEDSRTEDSKIVIKLTLNNGIKVIEYIDTQSGNIVRETIDIHSKKVKKEIKYLSEVRQMGYIKQILSLLVDRWTGLEGVLAVSTFPDRGFDLFFRGLSEKPNAEIQSLYQQIAKSPYSSHEDHIFQTLPGIIAILFYSNSLICVFICMTIISITMMLTELFINRIFANSYFSAVTGITTAHVVNQCSYPYLTIIFFIQLWMTVGLLYTAQKFIQRSIKRVQY